MGSYTPNENKELPMSNNTNLNQPSGLRRYLPPWLSGPWSVIAVFFTLYILVYLGWMNFHWGGQGNVTLIGDLLSLPIDAVAVIAAWRVSAQKDLDLRIRRMWLLLGLGILSYFIADLIWAYLENVLAVKPFPSVSDLFYLLFAPLVLAGLLSLPSKPLNRQERWNFILEMLAIMTATGMLMWHFVIQPTAEANAGNFISQAIAVAYPVSDFILIAGIVAALLHQPDRDTRSTLWLLLLGMAFFVGSDITFGYGSLAGTYVSGSWTDAGWNVAHLFFMYAALRHRYSAPESVEPRWMTRTAQAMRGLLYLAVVFAFALTAYEGIRDYSNPNFIWLLAGAGALLILLIGQQVIAPRFNDYSLRTKLVALFLIVSLFPLGLVFFINNNTSRQSLTDAADDALQGVASETAQELDTIIQDKLDAVGANAKLHILTEYLALSPTERLGSETETTLYNDLRVLGNVDSTNITSVGLLDRNGRDVADTDQAEVGISKSGRDYFKAAVNSGLPYVSPLEFSQATGQSSIYFSAPVKDAKGRLIGVLSVRYNSDVIQQLIKTNVDNFAHTGTFAVLFDENYIRLAHTSDPSLLFKSVVPLPADKLAELQAASRLPTGSAEELSTNTPDIQTGLENLDSQPIFAADFVATGVGLDEVVGVRLKAQPWTIVFVQSQGVFLAPVQAQSRNSLVIALIVAGIVSAVAFFVGQLLSRPIVQLTNVAQQIAGGDLNVQAMVTSKDEIGALGLTFNAMTGQLKTTLQNLDQRAAQLATVARVSSAAATILDTDKLLLEVVNLTKEQFNLYHSHIYLMNEAGDTLVLAAGAGEPGRQMVANGLSIPLNREQSLVARAARERQGVIVNDVTQAPDFLPNPLLPNTRSELAVPLIVGDRVLGVFDVQSDQVDRFTPEDVNIQSTLASQIAVALQNARQYEQTLATAAELAGIQSAVSEAAIVAITDVSGKIEFANDNFVRISKYSREELIGQDHRMLNSGLHPKEFIRDLWVTIANGKVWRNEIHNRAKDGSLYWVDTTIAPILNERGKPVKYMAVRFDITARKQAEEAIVQRAAELATVARVSSAAATILDADKLLLEVVNLTKEQFGLYHSHIYMLNEAGDTLVLAAGAGEPGRQMVANGLSIPLDREQSLVARAARDRQGVIVNDVTQAPDFLANPLLPDTRSELAVPLIVGDRVLGVFDVQSDRVDRFTPEDVNIQSTLASQIAVALQNVRAFSQAQRLAERETTLNVIGQKIQSATTVEAVLQIAARELGRALGAPLTIAQLGVKDNSGNNHGSD
jgi:PAS domain S-box-containing protein